MTRTALVVGGLLALAACGGEDCPSDSLNDSAAHLYRLSDGEVLCLGATYRDNTTPTRVLCGWECIEMDGRLARYLFLDFSGPDWRLNVVSVEYSRTDECL